MRDVSSSALPVIARRDALSHKGTYGRVMVIGGSRGMAGAPALAGRSALRSGAGLVTVAVPSAIQTTVASFEASYMTVGLGEAGEGESTANYLEASSCDELLRAARGMSAVALGPGLGAAAGTKELVRELYRSVRLPMIVDADALNAIAESQESLRAPGGVRILTPHPGEIFRLTGKAGDGETAERIEVAAGLCACDGSGQTLVVLKGHRTVVTDGKQYAINETGNPGMATGGTGDCLTGVIAGLVGQGLSGWEASRLGVYVHGLAGDLAARELGEISMLASDLVDFLPQAFVSLA